MANDKAKKTEREKLEVTTRTPKKPGLFDNVGTNRQAVRHPMREMIAFPPETDPVAENDQTAQTGQTSHTTPNEVHGQTGQTGHTRQTGQTSQPGHTSQSRQRSQTRQTGQTRQTEERQGPTSPIAPISDFNKSPNSITRDAIPGGLFRSGKSKHLYDVLYLMTRGAIVPKRSIRMRKGELMRASGIGSRNTFDSNVVHLQNVGLLRVSVVIGEQSGNEFEIFTPEEIGSNEVFIPPSADDMPHGQTGQTGQTGQSSQSTQPSAAQNLRRLDTPDTAQTRQSDSPVNTGTASTGKTFFKDFLNLDDEKQLGEAIERLDSAARDATGKGIGRAEIEALCELVDLFIAETGIAASRTESVSVYGRFGIANFKRRLYAKQKGSESRGRPFDPGRPLGESEVEEYSPARLDEAGREAALEELRAFAEKGYGSIDWNRHMYDPDDWAWLMENLEAKTSNG